MNQLADGGLRSADCGPPIGNPQSAIGNEFALARTPLEPGTTLIEASAGTGKTFTLAGLYLRLLLEFSLKVDQILVVTYTVAATGELRDRIRKTLALAHAAFTAVSTSHPLPPDLPAYLAEIVPQHSGRAAEILRGLEAALGAFDGAAVHTIHGFCQQALRDRAFESGSLFDLELLTDVADLERRAVEDFWRRQVLAAGPVPLALAIGEFETPAALLHKLQPLLKHAQLTTLPAGHPALAEAGPALQAAHAALRDEWRAQAVVIRSRFGASIKWGNKPYNRDDEMSVAFGAVEAALTQPNPSAAALETLRIFTTAALAEKRAKRGKESPPQLHFFTLCDAFIAAAEGWLLSLRQAALAFLREELPQLKVRLKVQSFDDLLTRLDAALRGPVGNDLAAALRNQYHAALIDEFQDTDPLQFRIFQRVFQSPAADGREPFLFLIGDPKQAIYGFRGEDLHTYLHAQRSAGRRYSLLQNFRSEPLLVEGVNQVFQRNPAAFLSPDIVFQASHAARPAATQSFCLAGDHLPPLEIWLYPRGEKDIPAGQAERDLPAPLATEIVRLLNSGARLGDRALLPEDIAILIPTNHQAVRLQAALAARGVPTVLQTTASLFTADEVGEMRRLLAALCAPGDESLLKSALATTALGLDAAQFQAAAANDSAWQSRCDGFTELSRIWSRKGFLPMFRALLQREGVRARLLALADGERRLTNLLHLAEVLHAAVREHNLSRAGLLQWLDEQAADPQGAGDAFQLRLERDERAVRIATIHRSKGLEYGVVFCPYSWKGVRGKQRQVEPLFHRADPQGEPELVFDFGSADLDANRVRAEEEKLAEQVRLLYVALTRAKHRCCFVWGKFNGAGTSAAAWLLHPPPPAESNLVALEAQWPKLTDELVTRELGHLAANSLGALACVPVPPATDARYQPPTETARPTAARAFTAALERDWRISSFSSLTAARHDEHPDYDAHAAPAAAETPVSGIFAFPRGARAGTCLHKIFEELDFTHANEAAAREIVIHALREHGIAPHWAADLELMIAQVLSAPLCAVSPALPADRSAGPRPGGAPGATCEAVGPETGAPSRAHTIAPAQSGTAADPLTLATISQSHRLTELEFCFPVGRLDPRLLSVFLAQHTAAGAESARFAFDPVTGLVKGFIDLIFEAQGRYYIVDWKSNWLGNHPRDYAPALLAEEIRRRHYDLQYRLYTVALDKYLRSRLPGYDYERHFGGVFYVFLRGVDEAHPGCGIYHDRPAEEFVREFSSLLAQSIRLV
jgi:exodeoxyribonuclease V beta subunit